MACKPCGAKTRGTLDAPRDLNTGPITPEARSRMPRKPQRRVDRTFMGAPARNEGSKQ